MRLMLSLILVLTLLVLGSGLYFWRSEPTMVRTPVEKVVPDDKFPR